MIVHIQKHILQITLHSYYDNKNWAGKRLWWWGWICWRWFEGIGPKSGKEAMHKGSLHETGFPRFLFSCSLLFLEYLGFKRTWEPGFLVYWVSRCSSISSSVSAFLVFKSPTIISNIFDRESTLWWSVWLLLWSVQTVSEQLFRFSTR